MTRTIATIARAEAAAGHWNNPLTENFLASLQMHVNSNDVGVHHLEYLV